MAFTQRGRLPNQAANNAECNSNSDTNSNQSNPNGDSGTAGNGGRDTGKRQRSRNEDNPPAACDQCRSRKVRCDRQQPECSNCRKGGAFCSWSSTFRRVNHTKQLRDDFSSVMDRLDEVHQTLNQLASLTRDIVARPCCHRASHSPGGCGSHCLATGSNGHSSMNLDLNSAITTASTSPSATAAIATLRHDLQSNHDLTLPSSNDAILDILDAECNLPDGDHSLQNGLSRDHDGERSIDSPASMSLFQDVAGQLTGMITQLDGKVEIHGLQESGVQSTLVHLRNSFPFELPCPDPGVIDDNRPVSTPPRLMVDLFIESFLCSFNASFPIFDEAELRRAVDTHYAAERPVDDSPWALVFTNIVLLGLGLEAQITSVSKSHPKSMHHELMSSFLRNCDRAIANLDSFTRPSVVNIQALLTLALVGKEFYKSAVFERALQTACHLARIIGLHRAKTSESGMPGLEGGDRDRLFRVLYAMDKFRTFQIGQPCDLYIFDSEIELDNVEGGELPGTRLSYAFNHIMRIWEEIYLNLYSTRAFHAGAKARAQRVSAMSSLTSSWAQRYSDLLEPGEAGYDLKLEPRRFEINYSYHITQVLILRCDWRNHVRRQMLDHSRASLRIIASIVNMPVTTQGLASLARMFQNYPVASFTELVLFHLQNLSRGAPPDESRSDDVELFQYINRSIKPLQHPDLPQTYLSRLTVGINWLLQVLETIGGTTFKPIERFDYQMQTIHSGFVNPASSRPSSHSPSAIAISTGAESFGRLQPSRGFSLSSSISSASEKEHRRPLGECEMTSFGASTPVTDPMSAPVGQGSSSASSLYLDRSQFDSTVMGEQSWDMDLWKEMFPS
ncbi:hypothetical protein F5B22DRAFT_628855 [Xylaria bambusicola]|uniref:uncharacterized protein n=1 Tax=Xylaria bambusicola TaxID=326684 RepID=UPI00200740CB|nr:uncharacterized protein F5B22DRAFT_628855 [Xylaria bambusicola]KAI0505179.1 hypothetical protein F5B22DRAFT_628855 [Xylaria bambusicola]